MPKSGDLQEFYKASFDAYFTMFSSMSDAARSTWFFVSDESVILSFDVGEGETVQAAEERHSIKLDAMADALEVLPGIPTSQTMIADLRRLAQLHRSR